MFKNLSENGKNIVNFEEEVGPFMLKWMPEMISAGKTCQFLPVLINTIKYNAAYLDEDVVSGLVMYGALFPSFFHFPSVAIILSFISSPGTLVSCPAERATKTTSR